MARRGSGEGSVAARKRRDGRFHATVQVEGKRHWFYGDSKAEAREKLRAFLSAYERGDVTLGPSPTLGEFVKLEWLLYVRTHRTEGTFLDYQRSARNHIVPALGDHRLRHLRSQHVSKWLAELQEQQLRPTTIVKLLAALSSALQYALLRDPPLVTRNVARAVVRPKVTRREIRPLSRGAARQLLDVALKQPDGVMFALELSYGMRQGEVIALRWHDQVRPGEIASTINLDRGEISLVAQVQRGRYQELKGGHGRRVLTLLPWLMNLLRLHRAGLEPRRMRAGARWREQGLVFPNETGRPLWPATVHKRWKRLLILAELDDARFHDLRHTAASLLLAEGATLFEVSRTLGHESIQTTADVYGHLSTEGRQSIAERAERALRGG